MASEKSVTEGQTDGQPGAGKNIAHHQKLSGGQKGYRGVEQIVPRQKSKPIINCV